MKKITTATHYIETLNFNREPCHVLEFINNNIDTRGTAYFEIRKVIVAPIMMDDYYKISIEMSLFIMSGNQVPILNMDLVYCIETFVEECSIDELYRTLFVEIPESHIIDIQQTIASLTSHSGYTVPYIPTADSFKFLQMFEDNEPEPLGFPILGNHYFS